MYAFLGFSAFVALILLLPVRLNMGRLGYLAYWLCLISVFATATQEFGYDTASYANMVELYWREPFAVDVGKYMSGSVLVLIAKITSGYNAMFSAIVVLLSLLPLIFLRKNYSLNFSATIFPIVIFFCLGNFKLGLSLPLIYGYIWYLSKSDWKVSAAFLVGAVLMHPQNVLLVGLMPLTFYTSVERIRPTTVVMLLAILLGAGFYVAANLESLTLFTRYFSEDVMSDDELGGGARFKLAEAVYQFLFIGLLFLGRREFSSSKLIFLGCSVYHGMRLVFSLVPVLDANLVGRGLLPFMILDLLILEIAFRSRTIDRRLLYSFQMLALIRLGATLWSGSLRNAIEQHVT